MPFEDEGGPVVRNPASAGLVPTRVVTEQTTQGGFITSGPDAGEPLVSDQPRTVSDAIAEASSAVKVIPVATAPAVANLPQNANPGEWFTFASQPNFIYVMCPDNIWRALVLISVV